MERDLTFKEQPGTMEHQHKVKLLKQKEAANKKRLEEKQNGLREEFFLRQDNGKVTRITVTPTITFSTLYNREMKGPRPRDVSEQKWASRYQIKNDPVLIEARKKGTLISELDYHDHVTAIRAKWDSK